ERGRWFDPAGPGSLLRSPRGLGQGRTIRAAARDVGAKRLTPRSPTRVPRPHRAPFALGAGPAGWCARAVRGRAVQLLSTPRRRGGATRCTARATHSHAEV